jgi:hypothetical protein
VNIQGFATPEPTERPLRVLVYGLSKQGKSHFVYTATEVGPLYWIDSERGSDFYPPENGYGFQVAYTSDPNFAIKTLTEASRQAESDNGPRPIVAIDSMSSIWFQQQEVAEQLRTSGGYGNFRAWGPAKKPLKKLYDLMMQTTCHVIITARAKEDYEVDKKGKPTLQGLKPDVERNLAFSVDHMLLFYTADRDGTLEADDYYAKVMGTRSPEEAGEAHIPTGKVFKNPRFSDLLVAHLKGAPPEGIEDTTEDQVLRELRAPKTYPDLVARMAQFGWNKDRVSQELKDEFGSFDRSMLPEYWEYLEGVATNES